MCWTNSLHLGDMATPAYHIMLGRNRSRASQRRPRPPRRTTERTVGWALTASTCHIAVTRHDRPGRARAATQSDGTDRRTTKTGLANLPRDVAWGFAVLFQG
jgi:hypothetical protein